MQWIGTLMLVEDEHVLRGLVAQFLRGMGFQVVEALDGPDAVEKFARNGPFDLIMLDLNLPGFSGVEVARRVLRGRPSPENSGLQRGDHPGFRGFAAGPGSRPLPDQALPPRSPPRPDRPAASTPARGLASVGLQQDGPMSYEIELKFRVADLTELSAQLLARGAQRKPDQTLVDHYLAHPSRDFAQTDEALRIRQIGNENRITYKGPKHGGATKTREEIELAIGTGAESLDQIRTIFARLGFRPVATVSKLRQPFHLMLDDRSMEICLDTADELGDFAEVETVVETAADMAEAQQAVIEAGKVARIDSNRTQVVSADDFGASGKIENRTHDVGTAVPVDPPRDTSNCQRKEASARLQGEIANK